MLNVIRATAALVLLGASLPALGASATVARGWEFKPEAVAGLSVHNLIGDARVVRGDGPGIHVSAQVVVEADTQEEAERLANLVEFRTHEAGAGSRFEVRYPRKHFPKIYSEHAGGGWLFRTEARYLGERIRLSRSTHGAVQVRVNLLVRAPEGARLEVVNLIGDGVAEGFSGRLKIDSWRGELRSVGGEGEVDLDTGSSRVLVHGHRGKVRADTGSGEVEIRDCECEILADTGSGEVRIERGAGRVSADTGSGGVRITDFAGSIAADTGSGSITARNVREVTELEADTGSGSVSIEGDLSALQRVRIDTGSGSVQLRSSAMPSLEIRVDTGSGDVDVDAPGARVRKEDGDWIVRLGEGRGRGLIDTGAGSVTLRVP